MSLTGRSCCESDPIWSLNSSDDSPFVRPSLIWPLSSVCLNSFYSSPCTLCSGNIECLQPPSQKPFSSIPLGSSLPQCPPATSQRAQWTQRPFCNQEEPHSSQDREGPLCHHFSSTEFTWQHHFALISSKCGISTFLVAPSLKTFFQVRVDLLAENSWGPVTGK